jgi:hypothetical protein
MAACVIAYQYKDLPPVYVPWHEDPSGDGPACYDPCDARLFTSYAEAEGVVAGWHPNDGMFVVALTPEQEAEAVARAMAAPWP